MRNYQNKLILLLTIIVIITILSGCTVSNKKENENHLNTRYIDSLINLKPYLSIKPEKSVYIYDSLDCEYYDIHFVFEKNTINYSIVSKNKKQHQYIYLNDTLLEEISIDLFANASDFNLATDTIRSLGDFDDAQFYYLNAEQNILCIKLVPMAWCGTMTQYKFFYVLFLREKKVFMVIRHMPN